MDIYERKLMLVDDNQERLYYQTISAAGAGA